MLGTTIRSAFRDKQIKTDNAPPYASLIPMLTAKARLLIRDLDPLNDLSFLRIRSAKYEIIVSSHKDYIVIVIQDHNNAISSNQMT